MTNTENLIKNEKAKLAIVIFFALLGIYDFVTDAQLLDYCFKVDKVCTANVKEDATKLLRTRVPMALPKLTRQDFTTNPVCLIMDRIKQRSNDDDVVVTDYLVVECNEDGIGCYPINPNLFQPEPKVPVPINSTYPECAMIFENAGNTGCGDNQTDLAKVVDIMYDISSANRQVVKDALFQYGEDPQSSWDDDSCWVYRFEGSPPRFCNIMNEDQEIIRLCEAAREVKIPSLLFLIISGPLLLYRIFVDIQELRAGDELNIGSLKYFDSRLKWLLLPLMFEDFPQLMFFLAIFNKGKCNSNIKNLSPTVFYPGFITSLVSIILIVPLFVVTNQRQKSHLWAILWSFGLALIALGSGILIGSKQEANKGGRALGGANEGLGVFFVVVALVGFVIPSIVLFYKYRRTQKEENPEVELKSVEEVG